MGDQREHAGSTNRTGGCQLHHGVVGASVSRYDAATGLGAQGGGSTTYLVCSVVCTLLRRSWLVVILMTVLSTSFDRLSSCLYVSSISSGMSSVP